MPPFVVDRLSGVGRRDGLVTKNANRSHTGLLLSGGLDGDHAFGDCSSRRLRRTTSRNPCRVHGNLICRSGPDTTGYYMDVQPEGSVPPLSAHACDQRQLSPEDDSDLLRDQQLWRDLKGLVACRQRRRVVRASPVVRARRLRSRARTETNQRSRAWLERDGKRRYGLLATHRPPTRTAEATQPGHQRPASIERSPAAFDAGTTWRPGAKRSPFELTSRRRITTSVGFSITGGIGPGGRLSSACAATTISLGSRSPVSSGVETPANRRLLVRNFTDRFFCEDPSPDGTHSTGPRAMTFRSACAE